MILRRCSRDTEGYSGWLQAWRDYNRSTGLQMSRTNTRVCTQAHTHTRTHARAHARTWWWLWVSGVALWTSGTSAIEITQPIWPSEPYKVYLFVICALFVMELKDKRQVLLTDWLQRQSIPKQSTHFLLGICSLSSLRNEPCMVIDFVFIHSISAIKITDRSEVTNEPWTRHNIACQPCNSL